jgi:hypothetical protein
MSKLGDALRAKFKSPTEAIEALGLDGALLAMDSEIPKTKIYRYKSPAITGDSKERSMTTATKLSLRAAVTKGAIAAYLFPRMAQDQQIDLNSILTGVTFKNFSAKKPAIVTAVRQATAGLLAQDADVEDLPELLDQIESLAGEASEVVQGGGEMENADPDMPAEANPDDVMENPDETGGHDLEELVAMIKSLSPEDRAKLDEMITHKVEPEVPATDEEKEDEDPKMKPVTQEAMDSAIQEATRTARANERAIHEAERVVRPFVGDLNLAFDSAEDVYAAALKGLGVPIKGVHPSAYKTILEMQPRGGTRQARIAQDAAGAKSFSDMFPNAARIGQM